MNAKRKAQMRARCRAIDRNLSKLLMEQGKLEVKLSAAKSWPMSEEETIATSPDKLQRFLVKCSKASRNLMKPAATTAQINDAARYFRKLVRVVKWLLITETKHRRDN